MEKENLENNYMPITKTGKKVKSSLVKEYGKKKGESIYYASIVKNSPGSSKWEKLGKGSQLAKAKKTYSKKKKK
ncbi:MAG: hypothetical protein H6743_03750 [Rickettsiaceae bacterium]|nr:hypothetical protein [Rickettsiaceae bacterium]